jgi:DNA-binding transcriptional LysR family regulator
VAAAELALSPSALSRRIQSLEAFLGVNLYDRSGPVPRLTAVGERYCQDLEPAIESIYAATAAVRHVPAAGRLRLMSPPSFAISWLMPQLREYYDRNGAQDVDLVISRDLDTLRLGRADMAIAASWWQWSRGEELISQQFPIASGPRNFDGLLIEPFLQLTGAVVAAPTLAGGRSPPRSLDELATHRLLSLDVVSDMPQDLWQGWLARTGYRGPLLQEPLRFGTWTLMYEACANGMGVTIAVPAVAESYLRDGRLKPCFGGQTELGGHYNLIYANSSVQRQPDVRALVSWLTAKMRGSVTNYTALVGDVSTA